MARRKILFDAAAKNDVDNDGDANYDASRATANTCIDLRNKNRNRNRTRSRSAKSSSNSSGNEIASCASSSSSSELTPAPVGINMEDVSKESKQVTLKLHLSPRMKQSILFAEPPLAKTNIVTGQPLEEPPNIKVKKELGAYHKSKSNKNKKNTSKNSQTLDSNDMELNYIQKMTNSKNVESITKLSTLRNSLVRLPPDIPITNNSSDDLRNKKNTCTAKLNTIKQSPVKKSKKSNKYHELLHLHNTKMPEVEINNYSVGTNQDFCSCCGLPGLFLCCESCPRSFHFYCLNPPMDPNDLPDQWFCRECIGQKLLLANTKTQINVGILGKLLDNVIYQNPISFRLPREIIGSFQGISMDKTGDYEDDSFKPVKSYKQLVQEFDDPLNGVYDQSGNPQFCYFCGGSGLNQKELMKCDYCSSCWHLDCLDPPLASVKKLGTKWKCPNHTDTIVGTKRKFRNEPIIEVSSSRNLKIPDDANFEILNVEDRILSYKSRKNELQYNLPEHLIKQENSIRLGNVTYQLKEEDIVLDFIQGAKIKKLNEENKNWSLIMNLKPDLKDYVWSLSQLSQRELISNKKKIVNLKNLLQTINDEVKVENKDFSKDEMSELLTIKRLMEIKGRDKLLEFLRS